MNCELFGLYQFPGFMCTIYTLSYVSVCHEHCDVTCQRVTCCCSSGAASTTVRGLVLWNHRACGIRVRRSGCSVGCSIFVHGSGREVQFFLHSKWRCISLRPRRREGSTSAICVAKAAGSWYRYPPVLLVLIGMAPLFTFDCGCFVDLGIVFLTIPFLLSSNLLFVVGTVKVCALSLRLLRSHACRHVVRGVVMYQ